MRKHKVDSVWISEFDDALSEIGVHFYADYRVKHLGRMFKLTKKLTDEQKNYLVNRFSNVVHFWTAPMYAPEMKSSAILITDKTVDYLVKQGKLKPVEQERI